MESHAARSIHRPGKLPPFPLGLGNEWLDRAYLFFQVWIVLFVYVYTNSVWYGIAGLLHALIWIWNLEH